MSLSIGPLEHVGVEVLDFDLRQPISEATAEELRALWYDHAILVFRGQQIDAETQIEISRVFGPLEIHPLPSTRHPDYPEIFINKAGDEDDYLTLAYFDGEPLVARFDWHVDLIYTGKPNHGAVLRAVQVPDNEGMTGFGDRALAYELLDAETQALLTKLEVAYHFVQNQGQMRFCDDVKFKPGPRLPSSLEEAGVPNFPDAAYPAVGTHPVSGLKVLQIVPFFLNRVLAPEQAGLSKDEADDLLRRMVKHMRRGQLHYFHHWSPGDVIMWDNWRAMHCTTGTRPGIKRLVHRTTILGDAVLGRQLA